MSKKFYTYSELFYFRKTVASLGAQILGEYKGENHSAILASILGLLFMTKAKKFHLDLIQSLLQSKMAATSYILKKVATGRFTHTTNTLLAHLSTTDRGYLYSKDPFWEIYCWTLNFMATSE